MESIKDLKNVVILYYSLNKNTVSKMQERLNNISTENYFLDSVILFLARDQIISNFDLISDEESKRVYYEIIKLV